MKRFQFRLARVRRAREISESLARAEWLAAEGEAIRAEEACDSLRAGIDAARSEIAQLQTASDFTPGSILASDRALARYWESLQIKRDQAAQRRELAEENLSAWSERERDRLALERLEERQLELHRTELTREEDAEIDEWGSANRRRKRNWLSSDRVAKTD